MGAPIGSTEFDLHYSWETMTHVSHMPTAWAKITLPRWSFYFFELDDLCS